MNLGKTEGGVMYFFEVMTDFTKAELDMLPKLGENAAKITHCLTDADGRSVVRYMFTPETPVGKAEKEMWAEIAKVGKQIELVRRDVINRLRTVSPQLLHETMGSDRFCQWLGELNFYYTECKRNNVL
jgi:hypothetical protein